VSLEMRRSSKANKTLVIAALRFLDADTRCGLNCTSFRYCGLGLFGVSGSGVFLVAVFVAVFSIAGGTKVQSGETRRG